jgi:putative transposase
MPRRLHRHYGTGDLHFITSSCYRRRPLLGTPHHRNLFLQILEQTRLRYSFVVVGYVVMPEHIHLLISEADQETPATIMQVLKHRFARRVLGDLRRQCNPTQASLWREVLDSGHVWQKRFYDFVVRTEIKKIEKLKYIHRNPVRRGLVLEPDQWAWSSFRSYALGEHGPVLVNEQLPGEMRFGAKQTFGASSNEVPTL